MTGIRDQIIRTIGRRWVLVELAFADSRHLERIAAGNGCARGYWIMDWYLSDT
jgi:hypothetical protein